MIDKPTEPFDVDNFKAVDFGDVDISHECNVFFGKIDDWANRNGWQDRAKALLIELNALASLYESEYGDG